MKLQTLYTKTAKQQIQIWEIEIVNDSYRTHEGLLNGAISTSKWTVCKGKSLGKKNETTPEEQALKDAQSKWEKKCKKGYSTDIDKAGETDYIPPMLAEKFKKFRHKISYPVFIQIKLNGARCVASKKGLYSRSGEKFVSVPHIEASLKRFFEKHPDAVLDGELFNYDLRRNLNELMSILGSKSPDTLTPELLKRSEEIIQFYVYDGFNIPYGSATLGANEPYMTRILALKDIIAEHKYLVEVDSFVAHSEAEALAKYGEYVDDGQEGAMLRTMAAPYEIDKRSQHLLKIKPEDDAEFLCLDIQEGDGNRSGVAGVMTLQHPNGETFGASFKGKLHQFEEVLKNKDKYIGKMVTIFYNGVTGKNGLPNYARFDCNNSKVI